MVNTAGIVSGNAKEPKDSQPKSASQNSCVNLSFEYFFLRALYAKTVYTVKNTNTTNVK